MKIGDPPKSAPASPAKEVSKPKSTRAAGEAGAVAPADEISLLGVPENEMTPRVREALLSLLGELQQLRAELSDMRTQMKDLETLADRDPHLDVLNRRAFARELDRALAMIDRYGVKTSLVFIDLNDLKIINDANGHADGDAALAHVAEKLSAHVRQTDAVGRLGGDEFGVLLFQTDQAQAEAKAQQLSEMISNEAVKGRNGEFFAKISWGAVEIKKGVSADEAMVHADTAMYEAKRRK